MHKVLVNCLRDLHRKKVDMVKGCTPNDIENVEGHLKSIITPSYIFFTLQSLTVKAANTTIAVFVITVQCLPSSL